MLSLQSWDAPLSPRTINPTVHLSTINEVTHYHEGRGNAEGAPVSRLVISETDGPASTRNRQLDGSALDRLDTLRRDGAQTVRLILDLSARSCTRYQ